MAISINQVQFVSSNKKTNKPVTKNSSSIKPNVSAKETSSGKKKAKKILLTSGIGVAALVAGVLINRRVLDAPFFAPKVPLSPLEHINYYNFRARISFAKSEEAMNNIVKKFFDKGNDKLNIHATSFLTNNKKLNNKNWHTIFEKITKIEPQVGIGQNEICTCLSDFYCRLDSGKFLNDNLINTILENISSAKVDTRLMTYQSLIKDIDFLHRSYYPSTRGILTDAHLKTILNDLKGIENKTFKHSQWGYSVSEVSVQDLKTECVTEIFRTKKFDKAFAEDFKYITDSKLLTEEAHLELIQKLGWQLPFDNLDRNQCDVLTELLKGFLKNKATDYKKGSEVVNDRFNIGYYLAYKIPYYLCDHKVDPQVTFDVYKELNRLIDINAIGEKTAKDYSMLNFTRICLLQARNDLFVSKEFKAKGLGLKDVEKYVTESLANYDSTIEKVKGCIPNFSEYSSDWILLKDAYDIYFTEISKLTKKLEKYSGGKCINSEEIIKLKNRLQEFGESRFNMKYSRFEESDFERKKSFNYSSSAKETLASFLETLKGYEEAIKMLKENNFDNSMLKKIKRKFTLEFHPDKYGGDSEEMVKKREQAEAIFKKGFGFIVELEKVLRY